MSSMSNTEAVRQIAVTMRDHVRCGMLAASVSPDEGWTILATRDGVRFVTPAGVIVLPDGWVDGDDSLGSPELWAALAYVEVVA